MNFKDPLRLVLRKGFSPMTKWLLGLALLCSVGFAGCGSAGDKSDPVVDKAADEAQQDETDANAATLSGQKSGAKTK